MLKRDWIWIVLAVVVGLAGVDSGASANAAAKAGDVAATVYHSAQMLSMGISLLWALTMLVRSAERDAERMRAEADQKRAEVDRKRTEASRA